MAIILAGAGQTAPSHSQMSTKTKIMSKYMCAVVCVVGALLLLFTCGCNRTTNDFLFYKSAFRDEGYELFFQSRRPLEVPPELVYVIHENKDGDSIIQEARIAVRNRRNNELQSLFVNQIDEYRISFIIPVTRIPGVPTRFFFQSEALVTLGGWQSPNGATSDVSEETQDL